jgi:hypothetical protein
MLAEIFPPDPVSMADERNRKLIAPATTLFRRTNIAISA